MTGQPQRAAFRYQAFYCEENVWHLVQEAALGDVARWVVFVSNPQRHVALWGQRAGRPDEDGLVVWDYHAIAVTGSGSSARAWDLDSTCVFGTGLRTYLDATFRPCAEPFAGRALVVSAADYVHRFASDRSHMRMPDGSYRQPPPPWEALGTGHNLDRFVEMNDPELGRICPVGELLTAFPA